MVTSTISDKPTLILSPPDTSIGGEKIIRDFFGMGATSNISSSYFIVDTEKIELLNSLVTKSLSLPIPISVEFDQLYFIAECNALPVYATGKTKQEAINNLKAEIEQLNEELKEDVSLSDEWKRYRDYLSRRIE